MNFSETSHLSSLQLHDNTVAVYIPQNSTEVGDESALIYLLHSLVQFP